jgi:hypothetical protein
MCPILGVVETERLLQMHCARTAPTSSSELVVMTDSPSVERGGGRRRLYAVRTVLEPKNGVNFLGGPLG